MKEFFKSYAGSLAFAAAGAFFIFLYTLHSGIGMSPDGVDYWTVARNFHDHGLLYDFHLQPMIDFPLGYPVFLALGNFLTSLSPLQFAPVLNEILFAVVILLSGRIMSRFRNPSSWYGIALLGCIALSPGLLEVYSMLWSETLFVVLTLLFFFSLHGYLSRGRGSSIIAMTLFAAIAADTRFIGVTLIITGGLLILLDPSRPWRRKWGPIALFSLGSITLVTWNLVRNFLIASQLTGEREKALNSLGTNLYYFGSTLTQWLVPAGVGRRLAIGVAVLVILVICLLWVRWMIRERDRGSYEFIALTFTVLYALSMIGVSTISRFENMDSRLLIPMFIPLLWSLSMPLLELVRSGGKALKRGIGMALALTALVVLLAGQLISDGENYDGIKDAGMPGYTEDSWQQSPTVDYLRHHPELFSPGNMVYSDADDGIYFLTGKLAEILPHKSNPAEIREMLGTPRYYVVWFTDAFDPDLVSLPFIQSQEELVCLERFSDGAIYYHAGNGQRPLKGSGSRTGP